MKETITGDILFILGPIESWVPAANAVTLCVTILILVTLFSLYFFIRHCTVEPEASNLQLLYNR